MHRAQLFLSEQLKLSDGSARHEPDSKLQRGSISLTAKVALALVVLFLLLVAATPWAEAQMYQVLHRFHGKDGISPYAGVIRDWEGNLYGTTEQGGDLNCVTPFTDVGCGVVFKLDTTGKETVLHNFTFEPDGAFPQHAVLVRDEAGNLYGANVDGGDLKSLPRIGGGVVFKVDCAGKETVLHSFTGATDGANPVAGLVRDKAGNLYGTNTSGGKYSNGVVFKLDPNTRKLTVLYSFTGIADGAFPEGNLIRDAGGNLYGITNSGGKFGAGTVFKLDPTNCELTTLYSFTGGADGGTPVASLIRDETGNLYGTTANGGNFNCFPGCGVVFKLDTTGNETVLYAFTGGTDGAYPSANVIRDAEGNFYGTTSAGGDLNCNPNEGCGVVFKLDTAGNETVLHTFSGGRDGGTPEAGLIRDEAGSLYGTTAFGGDLNCNNTPLAGCGVVFKLTP